MIDLKEISEKFCKKNLKGKGYPFEKCSEQEVLNACMGKAWNDATIYVGRFKKITNIEKFKKTFFERISLEKIFAEIFEDNP